MRRLTFLVLATIFCETGWCQVEDLRVCRSIEDPLERVACYDAAVDAAAADTTAPIIATTETSIRETTVVPDEPAQPEVDPVILFGRNESSIKDALEVEDISEIVFPVANVRKTPVGRLVIVLENGQIWVQADGERLNLKPGNEVRIRTGLGGSYYLNKTSGSRSIKVRRAD